MEETARDVLQSKIGRIKQSNVDPAWLADELLVARIVGDQDAQRAIKSHVVTNDQ